MPCDVLIPAALEAQIHSGNADRIQVSEQGNCHIGEAFYGHKRDDPGIALFSSTEDAAFTTSHHEAGCLYCIFLSRSMFAFSSPAILHSSFLHHLSGLLSKKGLHNDAELVLLCQARVVAEAANGPVTPPAEKILEAKGVVILPDLLLNAVSQ